MAEPDEKTRDLERTVLAHEVGKKIRLRRSETGWSLDALALVAGIGRASLQEIEAGRQTPRIDTLVRLAVALGADAEELLPDPASYSALFAPRLLEDLGQRFGVAPDGRLVLIQDNEGAATSSPRSSGQSISKRIKGR